MAALVIPIRDVIWPRWDRSRRVSRRPRRPCREWLWSSWRASVDLPQSIGPKKYLTVPVGTCPRRDPAAGTIDRAVVGSGMTAAGGCDIGAGWRWDGGWGAGTLGLY